MKTTLSAIVALVTGMLVVSPALWAQSVSDKPVAVAGAKDGGGPKTLDLAAIRAFGGTKGVTRPSRDSVMGFQIPTQIAKVLGKGGQAVKVGEPLVEGDRSEDLALVELQKMRAETDLPILEARKAMELAQFEYTTIRAVREQGGGNQKEVDRARLTAERSDLQYQNALVQQRQEVVGIKAREARLNKLTLLAPFDGVIDVILVDVGQNVSENDKVLRVVNVDVLWVDVPAPMADPRTLGIKLGDPAWVLLDVAGTAREVGAKVIEVSPAADSASRTRRIRIEIQNPEGEGRLIPGDPAWVRFAPPAV